MQVAQLRSGVNWPERCRVICSQSTAQPESGVVRTCQRLRGFVQRHAQVSQQQSGSAGRPPFDHDVASQAVI
jgi:hypothetical protein